MECSNWFKHWNKKTSIFEIQYEIPCDLIIFYAIHKYIENNSLVFQKLLIMTITLHVFFKFLDEWLITFYIPSFYIIFVSFLKLITRTLIAMKLFTIYADVYTYANVPNTRNNANDLIKTQCQLSIIILFHL